MSPKTPSPPMDDEFPPTGGPAFPVQGPAFAFPSHGMTLREYFAGQALAGLLALAETRDVEYSVVSEWCCDYADSLLKRLREQ